MTNINKRIQLLEEKMHMIEDINNPYGEHMSHCLLEKNGKLYVNNNDEFTDKKRSKHPKHPDCHFVIINIHKSLLINE